MSGHAYALNPKRSKPKGGINTFSMRRTTMASDLLLSIAHTHCKTEKPIRKNKLRDCGPTHPASRRFSENEVRGIRAKFTGNNLKALAAEYGTGVENMRAIVNGIVYAWVI